MKSAIKFIIATASAIILASCSTVPKIPADATSTQLIQLGQDALEVSNYTAAETYYNAVIQRYGMDVSAYVEASYELGHMYLKQKKYSQAQAKFTEILDIFANAEIGIVPAAYKKLAKMGMDQIPDKYKDQ